MTDSQWNGLLRIIDGEERETLPVGFIVDSVWIPGWHGASILDYFCSEQLWLESNLALVREFPEIMFLPGFWAEYGMFTEPSAFGSKCMWFENALPFPDACIRGIEDIDGLKKPEVTRDGLLPFVIKRLQRARPAIEDAGHRLRFATARGPLNIATFLLGGTELFLGMRTDPKRILRLMETVSDFLIDWLRLQKTSFPGIDGCLLLDDMIGFIGPEDFEKFVQPFLKEILSSVGATVNFLHNDASGIVSAPLLADTGFNMFNFSFEHGIKEMMDLTGNRIVLVGNLPPRDVLAACGPAEIRLRVKEMIAGLGRKDRLIVSCGGGVPPGVTSGQLKAVLEALS